MTEKELAYAWLFSTTAPEKVRPEDDELDKVAAGEVSQRVKDQAKERIKSEVAKWRPRFSDYLEKRGVLEKINAE